MKPGLARAIVTHMLHDKRAGLRLLGVGAHVMPRCCLGWGRWVGGWIITLLALVHAIDALLYWVGWAGGWCNVPWTCSRAWQFWLFMEKAKEESGRIGVTASNVPRAPPESRAEEKRAYFVKIGVFFPAALKASPAAAKPKKRAIWSR